MSARLVETFNCILQLFLPKCQALARAGCSALLSNFFISRSPLPGLCCSLQAPCFCLPYPASLPFKSLKYILALLWVALGRSDLVSLFLPEQLERFPNFYTIRATTPLFRFCMTSVSKHCPPQCVVRLQFLMCLFLPALLFPHPYWFDLHEFSSLSS